MPETLRSYSCPAITAYPLHRRASCLRSTSSSGLPCFKMNFRYGIVQSGITRRTSIPSEMSGYLTSPPLMDGAYKCCRNTSFGKSALSELSRARASAVQFSSQWMCLTSKPNKHMENSSTVQRYSSMIGLLASHV